MGEGVTESQFANHAGVGGGGGQGTRWGTHAVAVAHAMGKGPRARL